MGMTEDEERKDGRQAAAPAPTEGMTAAPAATDADTAATPAVTPDNGTATAGTAAEPTAGTAAAAPAAGAEEQPKQRMSSAEMLAEVNKEIARLKAEGESDEDALRRRRRDERWAAIGDGISAIANLVGTARGAKSSYAGTPLSDRARERYDRLKAERDANHRDYLSMAMNRYKILKGDEDAATAAAQHKETIGLKREELGIRKQAEENRAKRQEAADKAAADRAAAAKENSDRSYALSKERLTEQKRHNGAMEGISAGREARLAADGGSGGNGGRGGKGKMTIRLRDGSVHSYKPEMVGAINSLAAKMAVKARAAADIYTKREDSVNSSHFFSLARALEKAGNQKDINALVVKYIAEFPSLDGEIRRILGINGGSRNKPAQSKPAAGAQRKPTAAVQGKKVTGVNWNAR